MPPKRSTGTAGGGARVNDPGRIYGHVASKAVLGKQGRLVIPAEFRDSLGLKTGDALTLRIEAGRLVIERAGDVLLALQAQFRRKLAEPKAVDELLADRRKEARREAEK